MAIKEQLSRTAEQVVVERCKSNKQNDTFFLYDSQIHIFILIIKGLRIRKKKEETSYLTLIRFFVRFIILYRTL